MEPDLTANRDAGPSPTDGVTHVRETGGATGAPWGPPSGRSPGPTWPPPVAGQAFDGRTPWRTVGRLGDGSSRRRRATIVAVVAVAAITVVTVVLGVLIEPVDRTGTTSWDPRVTDLVAFVERERGLTFEHPVPIEFQSESEFLQRLGPGPSAGATDQQLADEASVYRALGLADDYDPSADQATLAEVLLLGYFDSFADRVYVRGSALTPEVRTVLVHELTHVLQSQHFELELGGPDDLVHRSLLEGDAMRIEQRYIETLPADVRSEIEQAQTIDDTDAAQLAGVPWTIAEASSAPYVLGPSFLATIEAAGGNAGVDAALRRPPTPEQLLDPLQYLDPPTRTVVAGQPPVEAVIPENASAIYDSSPFGLFDAVVMLDAWLPWHQTRRALDDWDEAAIAIYRADGVVCTTVTIRVDGRDAANRLAAAVVDWGQASGSAISPTITQRYQGWRSEVTFSPCDDDGRTTPPLPTFTTSYAVDFETWFVRDALAGDAGYAEREARCVARHLVDDPAFIELTAEESWTAAEDDRYDGRITALLEQCERSPAAPPDQP